MKKIHLILLLSVNCFFSRCIDTLIIEDFEVALDSTAVGFLDSLANHYLDSLKDVGDSEQSVFFPTGYLKHRYVSNEGVSLTGSEVTQWDDLVSGAHLKPYAISPSYQEDQINGLPAISMDNDEILGNDTLFVDQPSTHAIVFRLTEPLGGSGNRIYYSSHPSGPYNNLYISPGDVFRAYAGSGPTIQSFANDVWQFQLVEFNGSTSNNYINGLLVDADINVGTNAKLGLGLGGSTNATSTCDVDYAEVFIYNGILDSASKDSLFNYIDQKYGLITNPVSSTFSFENSINLSSYSGKYTYNDDGEIAKPILMLLHGVGGSENVFDQHTMNRFAGYGFFVCAIDLGLGITGNAGGDISHNVKDATEYVQNNYTSVVSPDIAVISGYSGGGGVALLTASRYPDTYCTIIDYFGPSDYGFDNPSSWYYTNTQWQSQLNTQVGLPAVYPDRYQARSARDAVGSNFKGYLFFYHSPGDGLVSVNQSDDLETNLISNGFVDYSFSRNDYNQHEYPNGGARIIRGEYEWVNYSLSVSEPVSPTTGTYLVVDHLETDSFEVVLNSYGFNASLLVEYDLTLKTYNCTPVTTGVPIEVYIEQNGLSATNFISSETLITL